MKDHNQTINLALSFADRGWPVFPVHGIATKGACACHKGANCGNVGKHPATPNGVKNATSDHERIKAFWKISNHNIGIATGPTSGLVVLDVDPRHGGKESLEALQSRFGAIPETLVVATGGGGFHYYFRDPAGLARNSAGTIAAGIDVRGDGGYVVAPGSTHESGATYTFLSDARQPLAEAPEWLFSARGPEPAARSTAPTGCIPEGRRNDALASEAGSLRARGCSQEEIEALLSARNRTLCDPPLPEHEVRAIAASIARYAPHSDPGKRTIPYHPNIHEVVEPATEALAAAADVFERGGIPVRLSFFEDQAAGARRAIGLSPGTPSIQEIRVPEATDVLTREVRFMQSTAKGEKEVSPSDRVMKAILSQPRQKWTNLRPLAGVSEIPIIRGDGSVFCGRGYDPETARYFAPTRDWPGLHAAPTPDDAADAAQTLLGTVQDFPFTADADRSAFLALILSVVARSAFSGPAPCVIIDANHRGTGKTLLAKTAALIATGRSVPVSSLADESELRKNITSLLMQSPPIVLFDDIEGTIGSPVLNRALTAETWSDRLLGGNTCVELPVQTAFVITANNAVVHHETARRSLQIRLVTPLERPEERSKFAHADLLRHVDDHHTLLATAAVTMVTAYLRAGSPDLRAPHQRTSDFPGWARLIPNALLFAGLPDPLVTRQRLIDEADLDGQALNALVEALVDWMGSKPFTAAQLADEMSERHKLRGVVMEAWDFDGYPNTRALGVKLRSLNEKPLGGKKVVTAGLTRNKAARWRVVNADGSAIEAAPSPARDLPF